MQYFYHPDHGCIDEVIVKDGVPLSLISQNTHAQLEQRYGAGVTMLHEYNAWQRHHDRHRQPPTPVTSEEYRAALENLPPEDWVQRPGEASFKISEYRSGHITRIYCRIGSNHFTLCDESTLTHEQITARCRARLSSPPVLVATSVERGPLTLTHFDSVQAAEQAISDFDDYLAQQRLEGHATIIRSSQISQTPNLTDNVQNADLNIAVLKQHEYTQLNGRWNAPSRTTQALAGRKCTDLSLAEALNCHLLEYAP